MLKQFIKLEMTFMKNKDKRKKNFNMLKDYVKNKLKKLKPKLLNNTKNAIWVPGISKFICSL